MPGRVARLGSCYHCPSGGAGGSGLHGFAIHCVTGQLRHKGYWKLLSIPIKRSDVLPHSGGVGSPRSSDRPTPPPLRTNACPSCGQVSCGICPVWAIATSHRPPQPPLLLSPEIQGRGRTKPQQNAYIERYNRTVRHEWLDQHIFESIEEAQDHATQWLWTYNGDRPNMRIGVITPAQKLLPKGARSDKSLA